MRQKSTDQNPEVLLSTLSREWILPDTPVRLMNFIRNHELPTPLDSDHARRRPHVRSSSPSSIPSSSKTAQAQALPSPTSRCASPISMSISHSSMRSYVPKDHPMDIAWTSRGMSSRRHRIHPSDSRSSSRILSAQEIYQEKSTPEEECFSEYFYSARIFTWTEICLPQWGQLADADIEESADLSAWTGSSFGRPRNIRSMASRACFGVVSAFTR